MYRLSLVRSTNVRSGEVSLRFRLKDGKDVDLAFETGRKVDVSDLTAFGPDGKVRSGVQMYNVQLKKDIDGYLFAMSSVYLELVQSGAEIDDESFQKAVEDRLGMNTIVGSVGSTVVERFRMYLDEEFEQGRISQKLYRESYTLSRKLERYWVIREFGDLGLSDFTSEMLVDFEKFCIDEYLYAVNPKYAHLYPRDYERSREWPKHKLKENTLKFVLRRFIAFWDDLVLFGEIEKSPYDDYVPWMTPPNYKSYAELMGEPLSLTREEFFQMVNTPVPERLAMVRNMVIMQCCLGCRVEALAKIKLNKIRISKNGVPYITYVPRNDKRTDGRTKYEVAVPLVRIAYDIMMRTRCDFYFGSQAASYNRKIKEYLEFCGIVREVSVYNERSGETEEVRLCDVMSSSFLRYTYLDILGKTVVRPDIAHVWSTPDRAFVRMEEKLGVDVLFAKLNVAFDQRSYSVDDNLNIIEGSPFVRFDEMVYKEQPEKLMKGRTNPYVISELVSLSEGEGRRQDRIVVRYGKALQCERKVAVCGAKVSAFIDGMDGEHRVLVWYGLMLLKKLSDFKVTFVREWENTIYELRCAARGYVYSVYFYLNVDTIVVLHVCLDEKHRRHKATGSGNLPRVQELRWKNVVGDIASIDYDPVLDAQFGESGTVKREVFEMRACCNFVSQALRQVRVDAGLSQEDVFSRWDFKADCGNLTQAETGVRVLPYRYLARLLEAFGLKAIIVRPGLEGWNKHSLNMNLEEMLVAIGEPVKRWRRKGE